MKTILEESEIQEIADRVVNVLAKKLDTPTQYIRTRRIPELYDVSKSYAEKLVRSMRESGVYDDAFIIDDRIILVSRTKLEEFWRERGRSK